MRYRRWIGCLWLCFCEEIIPDFQRSEDIGNALRTTYLQLHEKILFDNPQVGQILLLNLEPSAITSWPFPAILELPMPYEVLPCGIRLHVGKMTVDEELALYKSFANGLGSAVGLAVKHQTSAEVTKEPPQEEQPQTEEPS